MLWAIRRRRSPLVAARLAHSEVCVTVVVTQRGQNGAPMKRVVCLAMILWVLVAAVALKELATVPASLQVITSVR